MAKLEELVINEDEFDQEALAAALKPLLRLGRQGELRPSEGWDSLTPTGKVLAVLLAARAATALKLRSEAALGAVEIGRVAAMPGGTVRPKLRTLASARLVEQDAQRRYRVPGIALKSALDRLRVESRSE